MSRPDFATVIDAMTAACGMKADYLARVGVKRAVKRAVISFRHIFKGGN